MSHDTSEAKSIMEQLKDSTAQMHDAAESSQFQAYLAQGQLPISVYADYLEQLFFIHKALEDCFSELQKKGHKASAVVTAPQLQEQFLRDDLQALERNIATAKTVPATRKILGQIEQLAANQPSALLGMHYVLLGSKHGGKFIAKTCQDAYKFKEGAGARYFDPYGSNFMPVWKEFKEAVNNLTLSEEEKAEMCKAAGSMFVGIGQIGGELMATAKNA